MTRTTLKELLAQATPRPWEIIDERGKLIRLHFYDVDTDDDGRARDDGHDVCEISDTERGEENADLIVAAVNLLPALLEVADRASNLLGASICDYGLLPDEPDSEPVAQGPGGPSYVTFGHLRRLADALAKLEEPK